MGLFDDIPVAGQAPKRGGLFDDLPDAPKRRTVAMPVTDAMGNPTGQVEQVEVQDQRSAVPDGLESFWRGAGQGATLGAGDEMYAAGARAMGSDYDRQLAEVRARNKAADEAHPWAYGAGKVVGGVAALSPIGMTARGAAALGMTGANLASRMGAGVASGTALGGAQGVLEGEGDAGARLKQGVWGAGLGGAIGGAAPAIGSAVGSAARGVVNAVAARAAPIEGAGRAASRQLAEAYEAAGRNQVRGQLDQLGPDALLLDAAPSFQGMAQGLAAQPGPAQDRIVNALTARNQGTNARLSADVEGALGPAPIPAQIEGQFAAIRQAAGPKYEQALGNAPAIDTSGVLASIGARLNTAEGAERAALIRARDMLLETGQNGQLVPKSNAARLHNVKGALDELIEYGDPTIGVARGTLSRPDSALSQIRGALNEALESQVPGYAGANQQFRTAARASEALESGKRVLDAGENAIHPASFAQDFASRPIEQQAALRAGTRADIDRILGTSGNDLAALRRQVMSEGDWNRVKLAEVFGSDEANRIFGAVDRETAFRQAYQRVVGGSQSAQRLGGAKAVEVRGQNGTPTDIGTVIAGATGGIPGAASAIGLKTLGAGNRALQRSSDLARNEQLGNLLTLPTGAERDALVRALERRSEIRSAGGRVVPYAERLAQALIAAQGVQTGPELGRNQTLARLIAGAR